MQCVTPMFRYYDSSLEKDSHAKIIPRSQVMGELELDPNLIRHQVDALNNYNIEHGSPNRVMTIPCGYCWACKLTKSAEWASRMMLECTMHEYNYWITLTYDEEHLPVYEAFTDGVDTFKNDGTWTGTLEPEHVTTFINSIRQKYHRKGIDGIKYYYCGEYGTKPADEGGARPHYHLCIFGLPLDQTQFYDFKPDERHLLHWKSHEIDHYWGKGFADITELEFSNCAYTARYTMKKIFVTPKSETEYAKLGKRSEFTRMSRRPGIGMTYLSENMEKIYETDGIAMKSVKGKVNQIKPGRAFDKVFKDLHPDKWELIAESRKTAIERSNELQKTLTDYTDKKLLEIKAENIMRIGNQLPRILEA